MKIADLILKSNKILKDAGIQSFALDTRVLLAHFLGKSDVFILTNKDYIVENYSVFFDIVNQRVKGKPVAYIVGMAEFMSLEFCVNESTLIPRPDTEILVEQVLKSGKNKILEIGTGSGCIPISLAYYNPNLRAASVDISEKAIEIAKINAKEHKVDGRISFVCMDILKDFPEGKFDAVVSNPPYIKSEDIEGLMKDVRDFEPFSALCGGADGLLFYRRIIEKSKTVLCSGGLLAFEVGHDQSKSVSLMLKNNGYENVTVIKDLSGINRVILSSKNE